MAINTALYLHAQVVLGENWQGKIVGRLKNAGRWFTAYESQTHPGALCIRVNETLEVITIEPRVQGQTTLALREVCAYKALLIMSLCQEFQAVLWDKKASEVKLNMINLSAEFFSEQQVVSANEILDVASALQLILPRLVPKNGMEEDLFFL